MSAVGAVVGHVDHGAHMVAGGEGDAKTLHQLFVAHGGGDTVQPGDDAVAADLLHVGDAAQLHVTAIRLHNAAGDGMGGMALHMGGDFQHLFPLPGAVMHRFHGEIALGDGAGFIKGHSGNAGQGFQEIGAFDQNALAACATQRGKEAEGDADDHRAGAADDQEGTGTQHPVAPQGAEGGVARQTDACKSAEQWRKHRQRQSSIADDGGIVMGKAGDEILRHRLAGGGVLHQL